MTKFKPTYLYIKQHRITGLKYLGKTIKNPTHYKGSGKHWLRHLKKHGYSVDTIWYQLFTDKELLVEVALKLSADNDIVTSEEWANKKAENGLDGALPGELHHMFGLTGEKHPRFNTHHSDETKQLMRTNHADFKGEKHPLWQKGHSETSCHKMSKNHADVSGPKNPMYGVTRTRIECPYCGNSISDAWLSRHIRKEHQCM